MGAHAALTALWLLAPAWQTRPQLVEVRRVEVAASVRAVTVGASGVWYLCEPDRHLVTVRTATGGSGGSVGGYGWGLSALDQPSGVATDGNRVYVADRGNHRIVSYDRSLRPLASFATRDTTDDRSRFGYPGAVAVSGRGDLVVLDGESDEVVGFRPDGRVAFRMGRAVAGGPPLRSPTCLSVDPAERLLVGEAGGVRCFDLFGNELSAVRLGERTTLRSVAASGGWMAAVSADTLYLLREADGIVHRWPRSAILLDSAMEELWSVAWQSGNLLVLSTGSVTILRIEW